MHAELLAAGTASAARPDLAAFAEDATWLKLLHYSEPLFGWGKASSDITSANFFFAEDGRTNPLSELRATIAAMEAPFADDPNLHAQCRFPARLLWLRKAHLVREDMPDISCPDFRAWLGDDPVTGASLIFVSGHLENPSSFYGHIMLRLNTSREGRLDHDQLLAKALNHGAVYPNNENGIAYIFNGLTGGYQATFSELAFFNHEHEWTEDQLRDAWEYELELEPDQVAFLAAHSWETRKTTVPYFFLKQNCGYRIAELVSVVLEGSLLPNDKPWAMPVDILDNAKSFENRGKPLVRASRLMASRQTTFRESYRDLSADEQAFVRNVIEAQQTDIETAVRGLPAERQSPVVETLIDYYNMDQSRGEASPVALETRNALLVARMQRPAGASTPPPERPDPDEGNRPSLVQLNLINNSERGDILQFRLRGAYNDLLSQSPGSLPYSELTLGDIRVDLTDSDFTLRSAEVLRITTLSLSETGLPDDGGLAWRLRFGIEQDQLSCDNCLEGYVEAGVGKAAEIGGGFVAYGLVGGRVIGPDRDDGIAHVGLTAGLVTDPTQFARVSLEAGAWQDIDGDGDTRAFAQAEARFGDSPNWDVSLAAKFEHASLSDTTEVRVGFSLYW